VKPTQRLSPVPRFIAVRVVPALAILAGAFFLYIGVETTRLARESAEWPVTDGEIVRSDVVEEVSNTGPGRGSRTYRPTIRYRYQVDGVDHEGERVSLGEYATEDRADAERVVRTYPVGRRVQVHHRPGAPSTAVLEPGSDGAPWLYAALGSVLLLAGLVLAWVAPRLIVRS
jgi:hypothetical protein